MTYDELAAQLRYPEDPEMQELYVQTFEMNPACTLDLGWHLFGENYERGEFLVRTREQLRRYGIPEDTELPDHLTHVLPLLARMPREEAEQWAGEFVLPALAKIHGAISGSYAVLVGTIEDRLRADFPDAPNRRVELPIFQEAACG